jgi:hypothetical protein
MTDKLTKRQAYAAMFAFLEEIYNRTHSDELGGMLGEMSLLRDGGTADPAIWAEWEEAVRKAHENEVDLDLNLK